MLDITNLESLANIGFEDFKVLHQQGQNRASSYFTALELAGDAAGLTNTENYARLSKDIVDQSGLNAYLITEFTVIVASEHNVDFSPGSDDRLRMQYELMQADLELRRQNIYLMAKTEN